MSDAELKKYWEEKNNSYINRLIKAGEYSIRRIKYALPEIIWAENGHIKINKKAPYPDEDECMNGKYIEHMISTNKLIIESFGDWQFSAFMVKASNFSTRKEFDELMFLENHGVNCRCNCSPKTPEILSCIPLVDAFENVGVIISANMGYLRKIATDDQKDKLEMNFWRYGKENLEKMILYPFLVTLFGPSNDDKHQSKPKELYVYDFHFYHEGNLMNGTARHGEYYLYLQLMTS